MKVAIIGGGIAGCTLAAALASRGAQIDLFEHGELAEGASGNPIGILHPRLEKQWNPATRFYLSAFYHTRRLLTSMGGENMWWASPGMLQFPKRRDPQKSEARLRELPALLGLPPEVARFVEKDEASALAGLAGHYGALYFPDGTWVSPQEWCFALTRHPAIAIKPYNAVSEFEKTAECWRVTARKETVTVDAVIIANAVHAIHLLPKDLLPIGASRGQLTFLPPNSVSERIKPILCYDGYLAPARDGLHICGSTYDYEVTDLRVNQEGHQHNLDLFKRLWPDVFSGIDITQLEGRAALRTVTPDRLPIVGALEEGLYLSLAHGSRGLLSAPLAAELIAAGIFGEPLPCDADVTAALHPLRFMREAL
ncbi:MAG: FAD-dependent 5-carboxymethylaminomethyl-2-thiouridine(34) oxidoreductase MnmC [Rickettsiales bacterium]